MKKSIRLVLLISTILILISSCQQEENISSSKGIATFSLSPVTRSNGRVEEIGTPAFVLLSIKDNSGQAQENIKLPLFTFGQSYLSENLELKKGNYQLTQFVVLDAANKVLYAAPLEGSSLAKEVTDALPLGFIVSESASVQVIPQVLPVTSTDTPESFGYASFGFEVVSNTSVVLINARVVAEVGGIVYENLDAHVRIKGFDGNNTTQWLQDYTFTGPVDKLEVKNGFDHYSIELVDKWGINDTISEIPAKDIWDGRADGPLPVTYNLGGSIKAKKLLRYVTSYEVNTPNGIVYQPESRVILSYNTDGTLNYMNHEVYNEKTAQFQPSYIDAFLYKDSQVSKITRTLNVKLYEEYQYTYALEDKITVTNYATEIVTTQTTTKNWIPDNINNSVSVNYSFSNGNSFLYQFDVDYKNMVSTKTTKYGELCSEGAFTHDKNINPFRHLGYMDFNLQNWSINNRLTEQVEYKACGFPTLIPVSHSYTYDLDGYPVQKITTYTTGHHSKMDFQYK